MSKPEDFLVQVWRQQLDTGLRVTEAIIEGATRMREIQLQAAVDAHADAEASRKAIAAAADPAQVFKLQTGWAQANAQKCATYWRDLYDAAGQAQREVAKCMCAQVPGAPAPSEEDPKKAFLTLIDSAYKQWLDATQQFYKLPAIPAAAKPEQRAAA